MILFAHSGEDIWDDESWDTDYEAAEEQFDELRARPKTRHEEQYLRETRAFEVEQQGDYEDGSESEEKEDDSDGESDNNTADFVDVY